MAQITLATKEDIPVLVSFLVDMGREAGEVDRSVDIMVKSVEDSFSKGVLWFIFKSDVDGDMGCCHCQSVYNYWRTEDLYYMGDFYIKPEHRGQGKFKDLDKQLKHWFMGHEGVQVYTHIRKNDKVNINAFKAIGFEEMDRKLYMSRWGS